MFSGTLSPKKACDIWALIHTLRSGSRGSCPTSELTSPHSLRVCAAGPLPDEQHHCPASAGRRVGPLGRTLVPPTLPGTAGLHSGSSAVHVPLLVFLLPACLYPFASCCAHTFSSMSPRVRHICYFLDYGALSLYSLGEPHGGGGQGEGSLGELGD